MTSKLQRAASKVGAVVVPLRALWVALDGEVVRHEETHRIERVSVLGWDVFSRARAQARRARRRARKGGEDG